MAFINPLFLLGALALAGPILLHWLLRDRARRQVLPTLRLLPEAAPQSMSRRKLKDLLLLLARLLILALIVLAFARPHWGQVEKPQADTSPDEAAVFAVDCSLSMREGDRWAVAANRIGAMVRTLPERSRQALIVFDRSPRVVVPEGDDRMRIVQEMKNLNPGWGSTDLNSAMRASAELASQIKAKRQRVYFISDFQASGTGSQETAGLLPPGVEVIPFRVTDKPTANTALTGASEVESDQAGSRRIVLQAEAFGPAAEGEAVVKSDDKVLERKQVKLEAGQRQAIEFDLPLNRAKEAILTAEWSAPDSLDADNRITLLLEAQQPLPVTVLCQGPPEAANPYLRAALLACEGKVTPRWVGWDGLAMLSPVDCPVVIACPGGTLEGEAAQQLERYVRAGGSLILFSPTDGQGASALAGALSLQGWQHLDKASGACRLVTSGAQELLKTDSSGAPFDILGHPRVFAYLKAAAATAESARVLASLDNGDPFLLEAPLGQGRVYLFTVEPAPACSDFVLRPSFAPFLHHLMELAGSQSRPKRLFAVGDPLPQTLREQTADLRLKNPSGKLVDPRAGGTALDEPGAWRVERVGREDWAIVARLEPRESDLRPMDEAQLTALTRPASGKIDAPAAQGLLAGDLATAPEPDSRWRPWWYLLAAALGLMALETLLASRTWR